MTDAADDTFAGLTDYEPVYEMDVAGGALVDWSASAPVASSSVALCRFRGNTTPAWIA